MGSQGTQGEFYPPVDEERPEPFAEGAVHEAEASVRDESPSVDQVLVRGDFREPSVSREHPPRRPFVAGGKIRLFGHFVPVQILVLAVTEFLAFLGVGLISSQQVGAAQKAASLVPHLDFGVLTVVILLLLSLGAVGLYSAHQRAELTGVASRVLVAFGATALFLPIVYGLFPGVALDGATLLWAGSLSLVAFSGIRVFFYRYCDGALLVRRVLVVGGGKRARSIERLRRKSDRRGFRLLGFVDASGDSGYIHVSAERIVNCGQHFCQYALENHVDEIVMALDDRRQGAVPTEELLNCRMSGIDVIDLLDFFERETAKIRLDLLRPSWLIHADGFSRHVLRDFAKRIFDISLSAVLLIATLPLMALTAAAIFFESRGRGSVFYRQERVGQFGKSFDLIKFRSMRMDAEKDGKARWASENDPRVTRVGGFIRKYRLDELPQLWNVLRNDMSIVGPRPERPQFVDQLSRLSPLYKERHRVKPGIAGWAQLRYPYGASEQDSIEKLQYDLYYVKNHRLFFDLYILVQTVEVVLYSKGAR